MSNDDDSDVATYFARLIVIIALGAILGTLLGISAKLTDIRHELRMHYAVERGP